MDTGLGAKAYAIIEQGKIGLILSTRPTDRRQLIEEAAGITKYKSRRRSAELKLDAAQQNLTRIDDIVFEVDKQRGTLKRQAAKAKRYQKLRDELRRWEKVLFARKYRQLAETIESARGRLGDARERESVGRRACVGNRVGSGTGADRAGRGRIERHGGARARSRPRVGHQPPAAADRVRRRADSVAGGARRRAGGGVRHARVAARAGARRAAGSPRGSPPRRWSSAIVPGRRSRTAVRPTRSRIAKSKGSKRTSRRRAVKCSPPSIPPRRCAMPWSTRGPRATGWPRRCRSWTSSDTTSGSNPTAWRWIAQRPPNGCGSCTSRWTPRASPDRRVNPSSPARTSSTTGARGRCDAREQELAALEARLASLEELDAARAGYSDGARAVLAEANGHVGQQGAIADYLEVDPGYERAVEACLGDLVEHVVVERAEHAAAGLELLRERHAGRCGFIVTSAVGSGRRVQPHRTGRRPRASGGHRRALDGRAREWPLWRRDSSGDWRRVDRGRLRARG